MVFKCQTDSYLKEYDSCIASCNPSKFSTIVDGKKQKIDGYEIICEDTIIFPEGGGQPYDTGYMNDKRVYKVLRKEDKAIHYLADAFNIGDVVKQKIDWERRFDHMQQHSGQHLLSAILEKEYNLTTVSWWLGEETCYIELDTPMISSERIKKTESTVNELIRAGKSVTVDVYDKNTPEEILKETRSVKGLPADHKGDIRVINIEGIDSNMCCGTHVTNLSQLQSIKLLHAEKSKRKNQCLLHFLVGNRVLNRLEACIAREQKITTILNNGVSQHVELIDKLSKNCKLYNKNWQSTLKELAMREVHTIKNLDPAPKYYCLHRAETEPDFLNIILRELEGSDIFLYLTTGDENGAGYMALQGNEKAVSQLAPQACEMLGGRGAQNGTRYKAKVTNLSNRNNVESLVVAFFK